MSIHKSLRMGAGMNKPRSVYKRSERVEILMREGRLKQGDDVVGLPKVRTLKAIKGGKKKKKKEEE